MVRICLNGAAVVLLFTLLIGCEEETFYEIDMTPYGPVLKRTLYCPEKVSPNGLARLAGIYPESVDAHTFTGFFEGEVPKDVNHSSWYDCVESPLGSLMTYAEQFRGDHDPATTLTKIQETADLIAEILTGWFEMELGHLENFDRLEVFLDDQFRYDLKNIMIHFWTARIASNYQDEAETEFWIRLAMTLMDQNYLDQWDALDLMAEMEHGEADEKIFRMIRSCIINILTPGDDLTAPEQLDFLSDSETIEDSLVNFFSHDTELWQARLYSFHTELTEQTYWDPNSELPKPIELFEGILFNSISDHSFGFGSHDKISITLKTASAPLESNGIWDSENSAVTWTKELHRGKREFPRMFYAIWVEPNLNLQISLFQETKVNGRDLADFCLWFHTLADEEKAELSDFLYSLKGSPFIEETLADFKLTSGRSVDLEKWFNGE